ncbi:hypothetical protein BN874_1140013 [Candidatus Contendobacter odensis Run_B_J11]|uniref:Uncharacterized protein n=1 Tax=Candidatus Contendobacter odensis Run_B_J11 TaxID=1400861 RepID=A0A7U7J2B8_9GAMM|nr:hypothetical protein BN874_1140013 [Candidatus Contendobacter odensis Run_B_J11]
MPAIRFYLGGSDGFRGRRERCALSEHGLKLQDFGPGEQPYESQQADEGEDDLLSHIFPNVEKTGSWHCEATFGRHTLSRTRKDNPASDARLSPFGRFHRAMCR